MTAPGRSPWRPWLWLGLGLTAFKLWLTRGQSVFAIGPSDHDDLLFLQLARHLLNGEWLGPYNSLTLAKGPMYSLWIAGAFWAGVPLFLSQQCLYAAACALFTRACRPAVPREWPRFLLFAALLWNPMSFDASSMGRVLRQHLSGPFALLVFGGLVALRLRREEPLRRQLPWAILLGLSAGALYLTREETLWIVPSVLILALAWFHGVWRRPTDSIHLHLKAAATAVVCAILPVLIVSWENHRHYGWFGTVEFRASEFADAYGSLARIRVGEPLAKVPVTREARLAAYRVSPAFAELRPYLEGSIGHDWAGVSSSVTGLPADRMEIGGGWFMWALRDAVIAAGQGNNARHALRFYQRIADQINHAADTRQLPAGPPRSGFAPELRHGDTIAAARTAVEFGGFMVFFRNFAATAPPSFGSDDQLQLFHDLTRENLSPPEGRLRATGPRETAWDDWKVGVLESIGNAMRWPLAALVLAGAATMGLRLLRAPWEGTWTFFLTLALAAFAAVATTLLMYGAIDVTSFPVLTISSFAPAYPLLIVFGAMSVADGWTCFWSSPATKMAPLVPEAETELSPAAISPRLRIAVWVLGLAALTPLVIWSGRFAELFWFADDYFLFDQIAGMGFWPWTIQPFTETFAPLFKILWGGSALAFQGSHFAVLVLMWLTHALNTVLLGRLLARTGFPAVSVILVQTVFALTALNIETLGWTVQWSAILATTFLLGGMLVAENRLVRVRGWSWRWEGALLLFSAASACCFARGVLTGPILALALWLGFRMTSRRDVPSLLACVAPSAAVAAIIMLFAAGNQQHMAGHWMDAMRFGGAYFLFNPTAGIFGAQAWNPVSLATAGALKMALIVAGFAWSRGAVRRQLVLFLVYDLGNALLMGIGRHHTGLESVLSSRYSYSALIATLPFAGVVAARGLERFGSNGRTHNLVRGLSVAAVALLCLMAWPAALDSFLVERGESLRKLMSAPTLPPGAHVTVPALEFMEVERAKALIRAYHLH